jgi:hypothetical protein
VEEEEEERSVRRPSLLTGWGTEALEERGERGYRMDLLVSQVPANIQYVSGARRVVLCVGLGVFISSTRNLAPFSHFICTFTSVPRYVPRVPRPSSPRTGLTITRETKPESASDQLKPSFD